MTNEDRIKRRIDVAANATVTATAMIAVGSILETYAPNWIWYVVISTQYIALVVLAQARVISQRLCDAKESE